ncbi:MAG TPA: diguanylate cyclase, partial [Anaeromyxobacteraceae bacterium]
VTLPVVASARAPEVARPASRAEKAQVLVVDDDEDAREALAMMLTDDYDVLLAADGQEAMETAQSARPDLVLMDLYMPRMDGLAALAALRGDPSTEDVPVILISAHGDDLTRSRSLDLGAVDFLQKPFSGRELKARIERTLRLTRRETQLQALARTDPLTGLANIRAFRARLAEEVKRALRYRTSLACVMVDLDNLKPINDQLGHVAGDAAIEAVAEVIRRELRETDFAARYGGDEFVILLPHTSADEARVLAERVQVRLRDAGPEVDGHAIQLTASFGIAALDETPDDPAGTLVRRADAALYEAKRAGRARVVSHQAASDQPAAAA